MTNDPVQLGAMLFTLVDPHEGHEVAYNRWYERDHYFGGVLLGPGTLSGSRWVATRDLKDLRFPSESSVAIPSDRGSYLATYFIEASHVKTHFDWASAEVYKLYEAGRGFEQRTHAHTCLYLFKGSTHRDTDGVPDTLALEHRYQGLVSLHVDRHDGVSDADLSDWTSAHAPESILEADSPLASIQHWRPIISDREGPMDLGTPGGGPERSLQLVFCDAEPAAVMDRVRAWCAQLESAGMASTALAAPFTPTIPGTDTYTDRLW